ncbi:hypothetical protein [Ekhidna sp.]|uniref:hypothetical protein n=1 Tax=Ekhidna sp. TaxID=2608089 RepID=UPI003BAB88A9
MKLSEALDFFKDLIEKTNDKSESKVYQGFINILSNLKNRELTEQQLNSIELKLDSLDLLANSENRKKYLKRKLNEFTTYLNKEFSFITEGYYTGIGMVYGMMFGSGMGLVLGTAFGAGIGTAIGLSTGTGIGMVFGMMFGAAKDAEAKKQNRVLI